MDKTKITFIQLLDRIQRDWLPLYVSRASAARYCYAFVHVRRLLRRGASPEALPVDLGGMYAALVSKSHGPGV